MPAVFEKPPNWSAPFRWVERRVSGFRISSTPAVAYSLFSLFSRGRNNADIGTRLAEILLSHLFGVLWR